VQLIDPHNSAYYVPQFVTEMFTHATTWMYSNAVIFVAKYCILMTVSLLGRPE